MYTEMHSTSLVKYNILYINNYILTQLPIIIMLNILYLLVFHFDAYLHPNFMGYQCINQFKKSTLFVASPAQLLNTNTPPM